MHTASRRHRLTRLVLPGLAVLAALAAPVRADVAIVLNSRDDDMSLIDMTTYREIARVPIGKEPHHLVPTPDGRNVVVADAMGNELVVLDPATGAIRRRVPRIADPYHLGFSPDRRWFVVNGNRLDRVDIYRYESGKFKLAGRVPLARTPSHMAFARDSRTVYVTAQESDRVAAIDLATQRIRWFAPTGHQPAGIWLTPDGAHLLVALTGGDSVEVLSAHDGRRLIQFRTGKGAHSFLPLGDRRHVLLSNRMQNTISVIDEKTLRVVETFPVPDGPDDMELRRDGAELWVTSRWINRVSVIDMKTKRLIHSINVGRSPHGLFFQNHAPRI
jgi:YVTN family beta-propeller protein